MNTHSHAVYCHIKKRSFQLSMFGSCFGTLAVILASGIVFVVVFCLFFHLKDLGRFLGFRALSLYPVRPATRKASAIRFWGFVAFCLRGGV